MLPCFEHRFLLAHVDEIGPIANKTLDDLGLLTGKPPPISVDPHVPTLLALERMLAENTSGVPVVSEGGELIANLSISDFRAITPEMFGVLALPVAEFLAVEHHTAYLGYAQSASTPRHPFFASANRQSGPKSGAGRRSPALWPLPRASELLNPYDSAIDWTIVRVPLSLPESRRHPALHVQARHAAARAAAPVCGQPHPPGLRRRQG